MPLRAEAAGSLLGIARRAFPKAPMEVLASVEVTVDGGVQGDCRGVVKSGGRGRRQVTLMERGAWEAALAEIGQTVAWQERRVNLLVDGLALPREPGSMLRIGGVLLEVTVECDPCRRMELVAPGLEAALTPDWRGGVCTRVRQGGRIAIGDQIGIEIS